MQETKYMFEATNDEAEMLKAMRSKLMNILDLTPDHGKQAALWYGKLLTAFGKPAYVTNDFEDLYTYIIVATSDSGDRRVFSVYEGPTGPAIGGTDRETDAAKAMIEYVKKMQPTDYEAVGFYFDGPMKIRRGVSKGVPHWSEVPMVWAPEKEAQSELEEMFKELEGE